MESIVVFGATCLPLWFSLARGPHTPDEHVLWGQTGKEYGEGGTQETSIQGPPEMSLGAIDRFSWLAADDNSLENFPMQTPLK